MEIIGWTEWGTPEYEELFPIGGEHNWNEVREVERIISTELRQRGYKFTGDYHQNGDYGVPVFDNGKTYQCSQRTWGAIMAAAWPEEIGTDPYAYTLWAWVAPNPSVTPTPKDYE